MIFLTIKNDFIKTKAQKLQNDLLNKNYIYIKISVGLFECFQFMSESKLLNSMSVAFKVGRCHGLREPPHEESELSSEKNNIS